MASKLFFLVLLTLAFSLSSSTAAEHEAQSVASVIHIVNAVSGPDLPPIYLIIKVGGFAKASAGLRPCQTFQIKTSVNEKNVYNATVVFGLKFKTFPAYDPSRNIGQAAIYWRADNWGVSSSYDNANFRKVAPWESV